MRKDEFFPKYKPTMIFRRFPTTITPLDLMTEVFLHFNSPTFYLNSETVYKSFVLDDSWNLNLQSTEEKQLWHHLL